MAFHGTLLYQGQIVDELGMIYTTLVLIYIVVEMEAKSDEKLYPWLIPILIAFGCLYTMVYLYFPAFFVFFVVVFITMVVYVSYRSYLIYKQSSTPIDAKHLLVIGVCTYTSIFFFLWLPDLLLCQYTQWMNLHAWFHLGSTIGPYGFLSFLCYERHRRIKRNPKINYSQTLGMLPFPYIHLSGVKVE